MSRVKIIFTNHDQQIQFQKLISLFEADVSEDEIFELAHILANSGSRLNLDNSIITDIPSTGGPSSLTTLLCPLYLDVLNCKVMKLGIPGRPAGGIDVLAQIPGYKINYSINELYALSKSATYLHFLANSNFAPLDAALYEYRKKENKVNIPRLAVASLLSKKIAVGVNNVGLDIRCSSFGNFGMNSHEAKCNAKLFNAVAAKGGINAKCFISNASQPYQPFIGRGEALLALYKLFTNESDLWLNEHKVFCEKISWATSARNATESVPSIPIEDVRDSFAANLRLQGAHYNSFLDYCKRIESEHSMVLRAEDSGYCHYDLNTLRTIITGLQDKYAKSSKFPDPCGVIALVKSGMYVTNGTPVMSVRCSSSDAKFLIKRLQEAVLYSWEPMTNISSNNCEVVL